MSTLYKPHKMYKQQTHDTKLQPLSLVIGDCIPCSTVHLPYCPIACHQLHCCREQLGLCHLSCKHSNLLCVSCQMSFNPNAKCHFFDALVVRCLGFPQHQGFASLCLSCSCCVNNLCLVPHQCQVLHYVEPTCDTQPTDCIGRPICTNQAHSQLTSLLQRGLCVPGFLLSPYLIFVILFAHVCQHC